MSTTATAQDVSPSASRGDRRRRGRRSDGRAEAARGHRAGIRCREARRATELAACGRLRAEVYGDERGWVAADRVIDGIELDADDTRSIHLLATRGLEPVGTVRLILPRRGWPLPVEALLGEPLPPGRSAAEISRLAVARDARGDSAVLIALCRRLYVSALELGIDDVYAMIEKPLHRHLVNLGFPFHRVGPERWIYGSWNFPVALELARTAGRLTAAELQPEQVDQTEALDARAA